MCTYICMFCCLKDPKFYCLYLGPVQFAMEHIMCTAFAYLCNKMQKAIMNTQTHHLDVEILTHEHEDRTLVYDKIRLICILTHKPDAACLTKTIYLR